MAYSKAEIFLANKGPSSQGYGFPVVMYGCESWTVKKAEHWRIDAFEAWCWRRLLSVPWTVGRSNPSILKETNPEYSLAGLMLPPDGGNTLATWCEELTHLKRPWCWERLKVGEGDDRGWDGWMASLTECTWVWVSSRSWWWTGKPWHAAVHGVAESDTSEQLNWTDCQSILLASGLSTLLAKWSFHAANSYPYKTCMWSWQSSA